MVAQILPGALGTAIGVLIYSVICLCFGILTAWLVWAHRERRSHIFVLSIFVSIGTIASIAQQIHTIVRWQAIKLDQYHHALANAGDPELAVSGASHGLDLILFYIQFTCYNIESFLVFFWSAALLRSVFQLESLRRRSKNTPCAIKAVAILVPVTLVSLLQIDALHDNTVVFLCVANGCMAIGLTGSAVMLVLILGRYIYTRRQFLSWNVRYGKSSVQSGGAILDSNATTLQPRHSIYDRWLLIRFTIGCIALSVFQVVVIFFQVKSTERYSQANLGDAADLSLSRAKTDFIIFMPGATPPLVLFIVFGTTTPFRKYMWDNFVPRCLKRMRRKGQPSCIERADTGPGFQQPGACAPRGSLNNGFPSRAGPSSSCAENDEDPILCFRPEKVYISQGSTV